VDVLEVSYGLEFDDDAIFNKQIDSMHSDVDAKVVDVYTDLFEMWNLLTGEL
jgi:hypothetical protein